VKSLAGLARDSVEAANICPLKTKRETVIVSTEMIFKLPFNASITAFSFLELRILPHSIAL